MENPLSGTAKAALHGVEALGNVASNTLGNVMEDMEYAKDEVENKAMRILPMVAKGLSAVMSVGALVRLLDTGSALRFFGLERRRSVWGTIALFGAGMAAGAGLSMMVSPMSGRETREGLLRGVRNIGKKGRELVENAEDQLGLTEGHGDRDQGAGQLGQGRENQGQQGRRDKGEQGTSATTKTGESTRPGAEGTSGMGTSGMGTSGAGNKGTTEANKPYRNP